MNLTGYTLDKTIEHAEHLTGQIPRHCIRKRAGIESVVGRSMKIIVFVGIIVEE
ncbi:MAG: hypothetical protein GX997_09440 [Bacteroidales bacterium]|jgi:hypothetical protein|nr:hypothetical protein [Bacteroidales bacterium]